MKEACKTVEYELKWRSELNNLWTPSPEVENDDSVVVLNGTNRLAFVVHDDERLQPLVRYAVLARTLSIRSNEMSSKCDMHPPHDRVTALCSRPLHNTRCCSRATVTGLFEVNTPRIGSAPHVLLLTCAAL